MEGEELSELNLDGLLITKDGRLTIHDGAQIGTKGLHILADEDLVLLGLIPVSRKTSSEV